MSGDLALWRVRRVDHDAASPRGQLLRMRSLARGPHQHARMPVGQDRGRRRARRAAGVGCDGSGGDRACARRRRSGRGPPRAVNPRCGVARRTRPLRGDPRRARIPRLRAREPARRPQPRDPLGDQAPRTRRGRGRARRGIRAAAGALAPRRSSGSRADLPALWAAESTCEKDRKRLLRALIADITITSQPEGRELRVGSPPPRAPARSTPSSDRRHAKKSSGPRPRRSS